MELTGWGYRPHLEQGWLGSGSTFGTVLLQINSVSFPTVLICVHEGIFAATTLHNEKHV